MKGITTIILAAGKGTRMKSRLPKVLHPIAGRPMLNYVIDAAGGKIIVVAGHQASDVIRSIGKQKGLVFVVQRPQLGTAHAVRIAGKSIDPATRTVLILNGDAPLVTKDSIKALLFLHRKGKAHVTILTSIMPDPAGYGRIIRERDGSIGRIVEEKDAKPEELKIKEVNSGIYAVEKEFLYSTIRKIRRENVQDEYYLPDIIRIANEEGKRVLGIMAGSPDEIMGINTRVELARADKIVRKKIVDGHMLNGVTILDPESASIDAEVRIGRDTTIHAGCNLKGRTVIGKECILEPCVFIVDSIIGDGSIVRSYSVIENSRIGKKASVGPFSHLRPGSIIEDEAKVGNFVEVKKSRVGRGSKALHLTYLGDAALGRNVNIGAGTITCNYDGFRKFRTTIGDSALIGSDTMLVAPVKVGRKAVTGAGSSITKDVPSGALGVSRARQENISNYRKRLEERYSRKKGR